jgi:hypothetical protein
VAEALPSARSYEISDVGHEGFLEQREVVSAVLLEFLAN